MKKMIFFALVIAIFIILAVIYFRKNTAHPNKFQIVSVVKGTITEKAEAIGYIEPRHLITIKAEVGGKVAKIFHDEGTFVKKGDALIEIEPTPQPSDYATVYETLQDKKNLEKIALEHLNRFTTALKKGIISKSYIDYINSVKDYQTAVQERILAEHQLALMQVGRANVGGRNIGNIVYSPIDGYILDRKVDVGDPVISLSSAQSATALFTIANMQDIFFQGSLDEIDASKIKLGMDAAIKIAAIPDQAMSGKVSLISLQSEQKSGDTLDPNLPFNVSFKVEISDLTNIPSFTDLRAGYSATADINIKTAKDVLLLPERVIHFDDNDNPYVLVISKKNPNTTEKQPIKIGLSDGINVEITQGIALNETVVDQPVDTSQSES